MNGGYNVPSGTHTANIGQLLHLPSEEYWIHISDQSYFQTYLPIYQHKSIESTILINLTFR